jgi:predicted metalloprotease
MVKFRGGDGRSSNLEDRRGRGGGLALGGGAAGIIGLIVTLLLNASGGGGGGGALTDIFNQIQAGGAPSGTVDPADEPLVEEMADALDDIQAFWPTDAEVGPRYEAATLVLFTDAVSTGGCGNAPSSVGPFYCPADATVYIDLSFFKELSSRFGAPGDMARVYVLAHELGHHVQNLLGDNARVHEEQQRDPSRANDLSVRLELQADCYAGVWANSAQDRGLVEPGDIDEGLEAAAAVGDDRLQEQAGVDVQPESWTHGSSESRQRWFRAGFESGTVEACDTFNPSARL